MDKQDYAVLNSLVEQTELGKIPEKPEEKIIGLICRCLDAAPHEIGQFAVMKKGMTNRSVSFQCRGKKYIMRIPGKGTEQLINRKGEAEVYSLINGSGICDPLVYIDPDSGYKITEYLENARCCDPQNWDEVKKCMKMLREFHGRKLKVTHNYDLFEQINYYESLWHGQPSCYPDYAETKAHIWELKEYLEKEPVEWYLTHIDPNPDNFLFYPGEDGTEQLRLIDWEYAGMQDPLADIVSFATYAMYDEEEVDRLIDCYFPEGCEKSVRVRLYCYMAMFGLNFSNWCEFEQKQGIEFGEYALRQYCYAREYYRLAKQGIEELEGTQCG